MSFFDILKRKKADSPPREERRSHICARCKKKISESETHWILSHRYCAECVKPSQKYRAAIDNLESQKAAERKNQVQKAPPAPQAASPLPSRQIPPTPLESFLRCVENIPKFGPIKYKNLRFYYRVENPEAEDVFWDNSLRELDKMGGLCASNYSSCKVYKSIMIRVEDNPSYPDDIDLAEYTHIEIREDSGSGGYRFFLVEMYPDPWDSFFSDEYGGEITFEEFLGYMRRMGFTR